MSTKGLENLSDTEIHRMLCFYGFPNLPVTETTRNILVKKLENVCKVNSKAYMAINPHTAIDSLRRSEAESKLKRIKFLGRLQHLDAENLCGRNITKERVQMTQFNFPKMYTPPPILASESEEDSDYLNQSACKNMKQRLLSFRDLTLQPRSHSHKMNNSNDSEVFYHMSREGLKIRKAFVPKISDTMLYLGIQPGCTQNVVPYLLVSAFSIFFFVIIFMYMMKTPNSLEMCENNVQFVLCNDSAPTLVVSGPTENCIKSNHLERAIFFSRKLLELLEARAKKFYCEGHDHPALINESDFATHIFEENPAKGIREIKEILQSAEHLIRRNPQWKIVVKQMNETSAILKNNLTQTNETQFILLKPKLPFMCTVYKKVLKFFIIIGTGGIIAVTLFTCYLAYQYIRTWQRNRQTIVDRYLTDIVNELIYCASSGEPEVIINHLRDKMIPLDKRTMHLWAWHEALRILECSESRILFGRNVLNGEEFRTIRWIGNKHISPMKDCGIIKHWQSPAFGNSNKITCPPTPCLKIRHMFESSEAHHNNLKDIIKDAILEKVGARCNIEDIQIDKQSCCVYVRCASEAHAGIIHNEINGWWFDNRLVSIKFLRLQRYISRFPNTLNEKFCEAIRY